MSASFGDEVFLNQRMAGTVVAVVMRTNARYGSVSDVSVFALAVMRNPLMRSPA